MAMNTKVIIKTYIRNISMKGAVPPVIVPTILMMYRTLLKYLNWPIAWIQHQNAVMA